ncbi:heavy metal translocating P-type ATPase [Phanerochaete sordida]|uniref:Heavy metal translocating P-type ATPase n=1 Tax=Phanerochaete sordida TaxID=48140 RepID=A0A9P3FX27_9APHY|nr:heavy metal translocating P-type ATPase [Phanerochaete sordida]
MANSLYARRLAARPLPTLQAPKSIFTMASGSDEILTTVLVSNLHCSSCVRTIQDALATLSPPPAAVDVSIVTQTVTVRHSHALSPAAVRAALDDAGFDLVTTPDALERSHTSFTNSLSRLPPTLARHRNKHVQQCLQCLEEAHGSSCEPRDKFGEDTLITESADPVKPAVDSPLTSDDKEVGLPPHTSPITSSAATSPGPYHVTLSIGGMTCASCSNTLTRIIAELPGVSDVVVNLLGNSATALVDKPELAQTIAEAVDDAGFEADVMSVEPVHRPAPAPRQAAPAPSDGPFSLTLSVGGMTCAACSNTITGLLAELPGVSDVVVNVLGKSATATIARRELAAQVVETIEDGGYEAEVAHLEPVQNEAQAVVGPRTVSLRVEGLFCSHCPAKVMALLKGYEDRVTIEKPITSYTDPIIRLSYTPSPPDFTIRTILDAINVATAASSHPFTATIYHPPSLEERARRMQAKEQRALLVRLLFSVVVAIPTFIIGVVYMSLVPASNADRMWWMRPIWSGNASRIQWALFFCATPVMFYGAGTFHRRSLKEIYSLWRRGSRVPVWRRFVRFGSMNMLVSSGVAVAYFASIALLALSAAQAPAPDGDGDTTTYFDSVVFLTMFLLAGRYLEAYSKGHTADAITALGKLRPTTALLLLPAAQGSPSPTLSTPALTLTDSHDPEKGLVDAEHGKGAVAHLEDRAAGRAALARVPADLLEVGDVVRVQHGASPPADGTLVGVQGEHASFDESSLTGESRLVAKQAGDSVFVGTINRGPVVDVRVDAIGGETMLDQVVKVVREGQTKRAPIERVADLLTGYFVPVVTLLAILTWVVWLSLGYGGALPQDYLDIPVGGWTVWSLEFAIAVFVVACPCGIGLAAPTALLVGSGLAAKFGILVRGGGEAFQEAAQLDLVVFDKTGTLTQGGDPRVVDAALPASGWAPAVVHGIASELESASSHPLATALRAYCDARAQPQAAAGLDETPGRGLKARFDALRCEAVIGNEAWMAEHGAAVDGAVEARLSAWKADANSVVLLAVRRLGSADGDTEKNGPFELCAAYAVADMLREEAPAVVSLLQREGISTWMISGDNPVTAKAVAKKVGIRETNVIAGVLPHEKAMKIQWLQAVGMKRPLRGFSRWTGGRRLNTRCIVAMVGDGINDAPALSAADVGIAIGSGSDVAISSASFILVSSELRSLLTLISLSRTVFNRVKFNFLWATIYNLIALPIAAGIIYPAPGHPRLPPVWASLAMALSSVSVVCSSLLLKLYKEPSISRA